MTKKIEKDSKYGWFVVASSFTMLFVQVPTFHSEVLTFVQAPTFRYLRFIQAPIYVQVHTFWLVPIMVTLCFFSPNYFLFN